MVTENVHNYYETELKSLINTDPRLRGKSSDYVEDVICLTLNQLPSFYVRFDVDATAYMAEDDIISIQDRLKAALGEAIKQVDAYPHEPD
ncbi:late competence development ComFB family protein [Marinospirillum alkaliphilum]|uniref:Late competence development protein ComFB n=1 Tax=Marinospirillum alkaliphilum DSM 21637 TaxID=1122209 RepID=A0A1K1ZGM9_9GAMM|nr:late competence development ComFB family protein [Marinospirillum alkaliphilum]SFX73278.1 Late competence development protein ComFB [Marinospirillum alkaliphilum DSM 21637]